MTPTPSPITDISPTTVSVGDKVTWHDPYAHIDLVGTVAALSPTGQNALVIRANGGGNSWVAAVTLKPVL